MLADSKVFNWIYSGIPNSKRPKLIEKSRKHYYLTPDGVTYPSVTTMLSATSDNKEALERWRSNVGHQVANFITTEAAKNGTATHQIIEEYLNNQRIEKSDIYTPSFPLSSQAHSLLSKAHLDQLKPLLHNIDNIRCTEIPLYSDELRLAGTCDCIAEYNNKLSIIDFKTSRKQKKESWITNYFLQATAYSEMYDYLTNVKIDQIVILISGEDGTISEFVKETKYYSKILDDKLLEFENLRGEI
ncbi:PD-(D/E)XK nuclease family protein [Nitrosopumilus sp.]|uniref:PD-(D/E)XK nuclease family protein n=1 Tax=Nitrosopumilus sp. TaxID=2024843 RepID=UPI002931DB10|nr:PD-(D/E)XK nuclease family protein [Nitrosopumilus sp.]